MVVETKMDLKYGDRQKWIPNMVNGNKDNCGVGCDDIQKKIKSIWPSTSLTEWLLEKHWYDFKYPGMSKIPCTYPPLAVNNILGVKYGMN